MSLREEQCNKVCRILDNVLANRPTERDSLIVAVRKAFKALAEPHWIPVTERLPGIGEPVLDDCFSLNWMSYRSGGKEWVFPRDVRAWMPLPEAYKKNSEGGDGMSIEQEKMIVESLSSLYPLHKYEEDAIRVVLDAIPHWIPVTERLPKEDGNYLVSGKWGSGKEAVGDCLFSVEDGYFQTAWNFDVLAWCELPEPYKGVTE